MENSNKSNEFENELFLNNEFVLLPMFISSKKYHIQTLKNIENIENVLSKIQTSLLNINYKVFLSNTG